ncbi:putative sensor histidine kinase with PAS/PAC and Response regulator receiver domains [Bradyrhizobium sp. ORS 285]|uniref:PAS domain S-box protein n=1 Tax=Bradyrhizobium sp. ORS 285 TaxID=115808 RepID=UPI000240A5F2|nr:PAS domain S-box protein [Bradyrhizobium sp. ORS 285]CCD87027.1 putative sensor histidine kinase with PAS/PAC and Response regulator receiver domains [Bradyrhizobium sp. ORS 285]SMX57658.1 putative sensor histidine kinase with PAS/PAC and Response regulator receiver domains [Bradyrhizobium sp. ORS 285]
MQSIEDPSEVLLSTSTATRRDQLAALIAVAVSAVLFAAAAPFAKVQLPAAPAFVASYQSALALNDLITAFLLFSQFVLLRSRALLWLASGYLFTAPAALLHTLVFPGLYAPTGLLGAGSQSAVWIYMIWHGGFPLLVLCYALDRNSRPVPGRSVPAWLSLALLGVVIVLTALSWTVVAHDELLPALLRDNAATTALKVIVGSIWCVTAVALVALAWQRPHSILDLWVMVVLCAWLFDLSLSSLLNAARFDFGYYAGRIYGLLAASFVLGVLLADNVGLQWRLSRLLQQQRRQNESERARFVARERLFSAVVESSNDAVITLTLHGEITSWNRAAEQLFGYRADEALGSDIGLIVPAERRGEVDRILGEIGGGEKIEHHETIRRHKDGHEIEVSLSVSPILDARGAVIGASKVARDITESKRTRNALTRETEERRRIFETSQDLILVADSRGNLMQVSPSARAILGYQPEEMVGRNASDFVYPPELEAVRSQMRDCRRGRDVHNFEAQLLHKEGRGVVLNWMASWSDPVQRHFFIGRDLTEKRAAEAQFRQAQKMEAVGQLTGGVAHDFNNILTVITGSISILADAVAERPELASVAKLIDDSADRGAHLTRQLLAFARKQPLQPVDLDVNALMNETAALLRPTLGEHIEIERILSTDPCTALADPNQLATAVVNLSLNARDAMPQGGKLTLETANVALDQDYAEANTEVVVGDYVMIAVSDTGCGIPPAYLDKVFDPFFSTKGVGKGTGLGLSMVFGFVKQSGGHIKIYSEVGHGTSIKLYLPRSASAPRGTAEQHASDTSGGSETILIVEDDPMVRQHVITQVASLGYTTLAAANAAEALDVLEQHPEIDLLFTDVIMPGAMNGRQLADAARVRRPSLRTLFTSGYTENAIVHHGRLDAGVLLLAKPYRKPELARMIRIALDR